jgi:hypothetical protein
MGGGQPPAGPQVTQAENFLGRRWAEREKNSPFLARRGPQKNSLFLARQGTSGAELGGVAANVSANVLIIFHPLIANYPRVACSQHVKAGLCTAPQRRIPGAVFIGGKRTVGTPGAECLSEGTLASNTHTIH